MPLWLMMHRLGAKPLVAAGGGVDSLLAFWIGGARGVLTTPSGAGPNDGQPIINEYMGRMWTR